MIERVAMNVTEPGWTEREAHKAQVSKDELVERIARAIPSDGHVEPLKGVHLQRRSSPTELVHGLTELAFCAIVQGSKEIFLSEQCYRYDPAHYLLTTAKLPVVSQVIQASQRQPYLSLRLHLDPVLVSAVMIEAGCTSFHDPAGACAIAVSPLDANLLDAVVRLVRLLDDQNEARFLKPMITREIIYRLLLSEQGSRLRHVAALSDNTHHIAQAIERLRKDYNQPIRIKSIAQELGMSVSGFHHHFKAITAMSPLQFQKRLRLQEARRLMLGEHLDATSTAYRVGYDDVSQFTREYKRMFGLPPARDMERLRGAAREEARLTRFTGGTQSPF